MKRLLWLIVFVFFAGCTSNVNLEGSAKLAKKIIDELNEVSEGYASNSPDAVLEHFDEAMREKIDIAGQMAENQQTDLRFTVGRFIVNEADVLVHTAWARSWTLRTGEKGGSGGNAILHFDPDTLLITGVEGDNPFINIGQA